MMGILFRSVFFSLCRYVANIFSQSPDEQAAVERVRAIVSPSYRCHSDFCDCDD